MHAPIQLIYTAATVNPGASPTPTPARRITTAPRAEVNPTHSERTDLARVTQTP
jgi:hypothetical protein